jgi:hypothetical protein
MRRNRTMIDGATPDRQDSTGVLDEELRAAYDALGADAEENDVEFFLAAQLEVLDSE